MKKLVLLATICIFSAGTAHASRPSDGAFVIEFVSRVAGHAEILDKTIYSDRSITNYLVGIGALRMQRSPAPGVRRIFIEDHPELAEQWQISGLPTFIILDRNGEEIVRHEGIIEHDDYLELIGGIPPAVPPVIAAEAPPAPMPVAVTDMVTVPWTASTSSSSAPSAAPEPIQAPTAFTGEFQNNRDTEFSYPREFSANTLWKIKLSGDPEDVDIDVAIRSEDGTVIALAEGPSSSEELSVAVRPGRYTLRVFMYRSSTTPAAFTVEETRMPLPTNRILPFHHAPAITVDDVRSVPAGDYQWLRFIATQPGRYRFMIHGDAEEAIAVNSAGDVIGRAIRENVVVEMPAAGRIYLRIRSARPVAVTVMRDTAINPSTATIMLEPEKTITGEVGGTVIERLYRIRAPGSWMINLAPVGDPGTVDIDLEILTSAGELVERSEGPTPTESLRHEHGASEEHIVRVYAYRATRPVAFTLEMVPIIEEPPVSVDGPEPIEVQLDAALLKNEVLRTDEISAGGTRWYRIQASRSGRYGVFLSGEQSATARDIDLSIHRANGERVAISQNTDAREAILLDLNAGESVYARVFVYRDSPGSKYEIWYQNLGGTGARQ